MHGVEKTEADNLKCAIIYICKSAIDLAVNVSETDNCSLILWIVDFTCFGFSQEDKELQHFRIDTQIPFPSQVISAFRMIFNPETPDL